MNPNLPSQSGDSLAYNKERFAFCEKMYELESSRKDTIDKKAQFYFSTLIIFIGVVSFKGGALSVAGTNVARGAVRGSAGIALIVMLIALGLSILLSLISIAKTLSPRTYPQPYPKNISTALFAPSEEVSATEDGISLIQTNALRLAVAVEACRESNSIKSRWLIWSSRFVFASIILFVTLFYTLIFFSISGE